FFSPSNNVKLDEFDLDLGSSAPIALPSQFGAGTNVPELLVQDGKEGYVYLLDRNSLGGMGQGPGETDGVLQKLGPYGGVWDASAAWPGDGGYVYIPSVSPGGVDSGSSGKLRFFKYGVDEETNDPTLSLAATSPELFGFGSGSPIVTSDGTTNGSGVLWITRCPPSECNKGELVAYDPVPAGPESLQRLWHAPIGIANKFSRPDAAAGHVYVGNWEGKIIGFAGPELTPSTSSLNLGEAPAGTGLAGEVTLTNTGPSQLRVSAVRAPSQPFEASGLPAPERTIEPGETIAVHIAFRSSQPGAFNGSLAITTQAGETAVALSAVAAAPPTSEPTTSVTTATLTTPTLTTPGLGTIANIKPLLSLTHLHVAPSPNTGARFTSPTSSRPRAP
ncbi:MAG TPA: choice-of-anchor D domain-containing protein, partial [Solirubrobacteraceae bacterium]|nr:choice-of-anchor D domain-containing protein [Solirubrobacteraceae bacterium]